MAWDSAWKMKSIEEVLVSDKHVNAMTVCSFVLFYYNICIQYTSVHSTQYSCNNNCAAT